MNVARTPLAPLSGAAHDNELEEHPLMDYGVMRTPECAHSTLLSPTPGGARLAELHL